MRAEPRKETSRSAVAARVKALLNTNLGWIEGFPIEVAGGAVRWMAVPASAPAREIRLEGQHLSRATYALNKLRGELAPALALLTRERIESKAWLDSVEDRLERLKGAVHKGDRLPQRFFQDALFHSRFREEASALAADEPRLKPLLNALAWVSAGNPDRARTALDSVRDWGPGFLRLADRLGEVTALVTLLRLAELASDLGRDRVQPLAACLLDERCHDVPLEQSGQICGHILQGLGKRADSPLPETLPSGGSLGRDLAGWCENLVQQNRRTRQQALRLFELATPLPYVERWADWWDTTRRLLREAQRLRALPYDRESRRRLRLELERHRKATPPDFEAGLLVESLCLHLTEEASGRTAPLTRALALVPPEATAPGRPHFAVYWTLLGSMEDASEAQILLLLSGFERYLKHLKNGPRPDLQPWATLASPSWAYSETVERELLDRESSKLPRRTVLAAYDHLAALTSRYRSLEPRAAVQALELFLRAGDPDVAARLFESLRSQGRLELYPYRSSTQIAIRLCRERPERFAAVLEALRRQEDRDDLQPSDWPEPLLAALSTGATGDLVRDLIVTGQLDRLLACGAKARLLASADAADAPLPLPRLGEALSPAWMERYPPELHPEIRRLAGLLEDAESRVVHWLAADLPDSARLKREIQAIEQRLPGTDPERQPALRTRLANLRARLEQPPALSPARLKRLRARLGRAWGRAVLDRWEGEIDARLPGVLCQLLGIEEVPSWLRENRNLALLAAACQLSDRHRKLACHLFRLRCGPPPWDLRDAPQNRRFVESLPELDWRPWIDGVGTLAVGTAFGGTDRTLHLALEDDPLKIFLMGAHFQTCLSPGAMNYFSVFANAADINKRVLYARETPGGKVFGRCLLALTVRGELLTFEPYCHDGGVEFERICADFAQDLARRMGTVRAPRGKVPTLVAPRWYDDGPQDLGRCYPALEEGSALRRGLAAVRPGELIEELRRRLKPARLDETTLPLVLSLPEVQQRPELAVPLLRPVAQCRVFPDSALITAASLAVEAGASDLVRRLLLPLLADHLRRGYQGRVYCDARAIDLLLRLDPARLLAVLRQTRERDVRGWLDEFYGYRLEGAARALEALYRPRQALALWRHLATSTSVYAGDEDVRQRAREAVERLSKAASSPAPAS